MKNNLIASIYFGKTCTLFTLIEKSDTAFCLHYLNSLSHPINLNDLHSEDTQKSISELHSIIEDYKNDISFFFVTIDTKFSIITKIPGECDTSSSEFMDLINLEIRQNFPDLSISDFRVKTTKLNYEPFMNLVIITSKELLNSIEDIVKNLGFELTDINVSLFSAINTFNYNYPDKLGQLNIIVHINENILEFGIIENNKIIDYEFYCLSNADNISQAVERKVNYIVKDLKINEIAGIYFFGQDLTKQDYIKCWEVSMLVSMDSKRLNPFRMFDTVLDKRDLEYCARMFHTFPACIGGALPTQFSVVVT